MVPLALGVHGGDEAHMCVFVPRLANAKSRHSYWWKCPAAIQGAPVDGTRISRGARLGPPRVERQRTYTISASVGLAGLGRAE